MTGVKQLAKYAKAWVAALGVAAEVINALGFGGNKYAAIVIAVAGALGVYGVPNRERSTRGLQAG